MSNDQCRIAEHQAEAHGELDHDSENCTCEPRDCDCFDCGGDQPTHSSTCSYMSEIVGSDCPRSAADPRHKPNYRLCACNDCVPF